GPPQWLGKESWLATSLNRPSVPQASCDSGVAYLALHQGTDAIAEFQKINEHRGLMTNCPLGALAQLQVGRAYAMADDTSQARLQRFPHPLERRRPRHSHPEASQGRVREAAMRTLGIGFLPFHVRPFSTCPRPPPCKEESPLSLSELPSLSPP